MTDRITESERFKGTAQYFRSEPGGTQLGTAERESLMAQMAIAQELASLVDLMRERTGLEPTMAQTWDRIDGVEKRFDILEGAVGRAVSKGELGLLSDRLDALDENATVVCGGLADRLTAIEPKLVQMEQDWLNQAMNPGLGRGGAQDDPQRR